MKHNEPFEIVPYIGAGRVRFRMSPQEVEKIYGVADSVTLNHLKQRVEFRSNMKVGYAADLSEGLTHIGFGRQMEGVEFRGLKIFLDDSEVVLDKLIQEDGDPYIYLGFVVLLKIGITMTGFHDDDISQKALTLFPQGSWDKRRAKLKPFR
ncbi:hypothetical protein OU994_11160 [Pseudoduganella sp. SL102]|uniref:hypothetical protein n=1 Tax=Pseudoduganella sp. SL102 TaxID=2995154 RepID=UPI00248C25F2|nr:hypothetical protein [Pseudoduganella sp. SL102]WBS04787.1 hypothetical protein OU994_11160 [Pseudoduganella sp. SL102]